jgi:hypothetical protein
MSFHDQQYAPAVSRGLPELFWRRRRQPRNASEQTGIGALRQGAAFAAFAGAFLGCLATLHLSACGFVPAIASALATILLCGPVLATRTTNLFPAEVFAAIYGGTFAGMTPILGLIDNARGGAVMSASALFILLSIVCGLVFCVVAEIDTRSGRRLAGGCGGRSGAVAAVASLLFVESAPLFGANGALIRVAQADMSDVAPLSAALTCAACMIGTFATLIVLRRPRFASAEPANRIFIAAVVALIGLIALRVSTPDETCILDAFYAGCFLGMSTPERLKGWIEPCLGAILLTAILVVVRELLPGVGGGLGFAALLTVAALAVVRRIWLTNGILGRDPAAAASGRGHAGTGASVWALRGRAIAVSGSLAALLATGCFVGPAQVAPEAPGLETAASAQLAEQSAPSRVTLASVEDKPASAEAVNVDLGAVTTLSPEPNGMAISTGQGDGGAAGAPAEPARADRAEGASTAKVETAQSGVPVHDAPETGEGLFREFLRWRTARSDAIAQPAPQPVKRSRNRAVQVVRLTPAGSWLLPQPPARERRPDRPKLASATEPAAPGQRISPRTPARNTGSRSAPGQTVP